MPDEPAPPNEDLDKQNVTAEVGSEGGSSGNVEVEVTRDIGTGSEANETWRPSSVEKEKDVVRHDETGEGRRSP
jgi:hypothetical protein